MKAVMLKDIEEMFWYIIYGKANENEFIEWANNKGMEDDNFEFSLADIYYELKVGNKGLRFLKNRFKANDMKIIVKG
jgi:hypothetical protein